ncbi:hypothetical protein Q4F19_05850 [Sphingomonas sp. BIUV-7]|uniref:Uncharacterized protein n=1 Tax=Sphingomonas natans TaxID=3063330 RepID=A0ABT8Y6F0_9SPHN|nr:hypothetical protein [Sphingomonas sp. BIUV-7]MDO6413898.1 hypothetical protein [Sphingomonas sp. BIUV-7]
MVGFPAVAMMLFSFGLPVALTLLVLKLMPRPSRPVMAATMLAAAAIFPLALLSLVHSTSAVTQAGNVQIAWVTFAGGLVLSWLTFSIRRAA